MILPPDITQLITTYDQPGPRYTSYPTAPQFDEQVSREALIQECMELDEAASLYMHIPFCESNCWFCGCNTLITSRRKGADQYLDLIEEECRIMEGGSGRRKASSLHLGGGTPNFLTLPQISRLFDLLRHCFDWQKDAEVSVELAPNYLDEDQIDAFVANGMRRASFGVQDVNPEVQAAINRIQPQETNRRVMEQLRARGIQSINIDLIYGLPLQTADGFRRTLESVLELQPDRLAVFNYAHVPHIKPFQRKLEQHPMPDPAQKIAILLTIIETLTKAGYHYIGLDHFAKPQDELFRAQEAKRLHRNFQGYTVMNEKEVIALGLSSISETQRSYRQNFRDMERYRSAIHSGRWPIARGILLSPEDLARRWVIRSLMCNLELDFGALRLNHPEYAPAILKTVETRMPDFERNGLLSIQNDCIRVTELGRLFLRNIAMPFDAYLDHDKTRYSRTV
jgi:oxygen-independent coproporphyrinogen-3 oxidase